MAVGSSNDFDLVVLGAGTGGYSAAFRAAQLGLKVALVDEDKIGGTCLHRGCIPTKALLESAAFTDKVRHAKDYGLVLPGEAVVDYAAMAARRDAVVKRMWTGLKTLIDKNKVTWVAGRGRLDGPGKVKISQTGEDGTPGGGGERVLNATDVILATGSRVKSLPGLTPDGKRILTSDDVLKLDTLPKDIVIVGAGAVGRRVRQHVRRRRGQGDRARIPAADRPARGRRREQGRRAQLHQARHHRDDQRPVRRRIGHRRRQRHLPDGRPGGQGPGRAPRRGHAGRHRPLRQHRGHRARDDQGRDRPRGHQGQRPDADQGAARVRHRRRHRRAVAGTHRGARGAHRGAHDRRRSRRPRHGLHEPAARDVLPPGDRLDRADRGTGDRGRPQAQDRQGPVPGHRQGDHRRRVRGFRQGHRRRRQRRHARRPRRRAARHRPDRGGVARPSSSTRRRGRSAPRPTPTRPCPKSSARPPWPSTGGRSTSRQPGRATARRHEEAGPAAWRSPTAATPISARASA